MSGASPAPPRGDPSAATRLSRIRPRLHCLLLLVAGPPLIFLLAHLFGGESSQAAGIATAATAALAAAVAACGSIGLDSRARQTWLVISVGLALWSIGRLIAVLQAALTVDGLYRVAVANAGYVAMVPVVGSGVLLLLPRRREHGVGLKLALDAVIALASLLTITWFFVLNPVWSASGLSQQAKVVAAVHAVGNVALLMALLVVGLRLGNRPITPALGALAGGLLCFVLADTLALQHWLAGQPSAGAAAEGLWTVGFLAIGLATLLERRTADGADAMAPAADREPLWRVVLPYPLALALVLLVVWQVLTGTANRSGTWILITCLTLVAVIIIRQGLTVRDERRLSQHLSRQVDRDPLTGLINRRKVHDRIARELEHGREWGHPLAIALIDVDDFKAINDRYGHQVGDEVLRTLASTLTASCRGTDVAARYAGDEFLLVLPGADLDAARVVCDRILRHVRAMRAATSQGQPVISLSIGVAATRRHARSAEQLVAIADAAMYDAKEAGKDSAVIVDADTLVAEAPLRADSAAVPAREAVAEPSAREMALRAVVP